MGFQLDVSVPAAAVFLQGLLSFFSPCVLPLIPLYIGYLSGGTARRGEDGRMHYRQSRVMLHTVFFVIGVSFAFFILGLGVSAAGMFFKSNQLLLARIGGVVVILFGLYQTGLFGTSAALGKERRLPLRIDKLAMSPATALLMGFTFSFAWTPCVGPALARVLIMAASASTRSAGMGLIGIYTLGFVIPFLVVGLFTTSLLEIFKAHMNVVRYTVKIGGVLMILMGVLMFTGKMNSVTGYLSRISGQTENSAVVSGEDGQDGDSAVVPEADGQDGASAVVSGEDGQDGDSAAPGQPVEEDTISPTAEGPADVESMENGPGNPSDGEGEDGGSTGGETAGGTDEEEIPKIPALDFTLQDQYGNTHSLSDYEGKTIFLNFWGTWCPPCRAEMPEIQKLYESYSQEGEDALIVLGVAAPGMSGEGTELEITAFLTENGYTYPVLMDTDWELFMGYGIMSFPTTFMIDREGNIFGYVSGQLSYDMMESIVRQTMEGR